MLAKTGGLDTADGGTADGVAAGTTADVVAVAGGLGGTADGVAAGAMAEVVAAAGFVGGLRSVNTLRVYMIIIILYKRLLRHLMEQHTSYNIMQDLLPSVVEHCVWS